MKIWKRTVPVLFSVVSGHSADGVDLQTEIIKYYERNSERGLGGDQRKAANCDQSELPNINDG